MFFLVLFFCSKCCNSVHGLHTWIFMMSLGVDVPIGCLQVHLGSLESQKDGRIFLVQKPSTCILSIRHQGAIVVVPNTEENFPLYAYAYWLHTFTWTIETSLQFNHTMNENFEMGRGLRHASDIFTGDRLVNNAVVFSFNGWYQKSVCLVKNTLVSKVGSDRIGQEKEKMQLFSNYQL